MSFETERRVFPRSCAYRTGGVLLGCGVDLRRSFCRNRNPKEFEEGERGDEEENVHPGEQPTRLQGERNGDREAREHALADRDVHGARVIRMSATDEEADDRCGSRSGEEGNAVEHEPPERTEIRGERSRNRHAPNDPCEHRGEYGESEWRAQETHRRAELRDPRSPIVRNHRTSPQSEEQLWRCRIRSAPWDEGEAIDRDPGVRIANAVPDRLLPQPNGLRNR